MKVLAKAKIESALDKLAKQADVLVPMQRGPQSGFFSWKTFDDYNDDLILDILNVYMPPKHVVLSNSRKTNVQRSEDSDKNDSDIETKIVFGIRSCDIQGIEFLDEIFSGSGSEDSNYRAHRGKTIIIASACYYPAPSCFCTSMGVNPVEAASADVIISDVGKDGYVWEAKTDKGKIITAQIEDLLEDKKVVLPEAKSPSRIVDYAGVAEKLKQMQEHPLWEKLSEPCPACGVCTYSCPTCYCFDTWIDNWGSEGYPFACYNSCMYREHSLTIGANNPRTAATERFRNRFLHKLEFYPEKYGRPLCTGCGRCIVLCPSGVSIASIINEVNKKDEI